MDEIAKGAARWDGKELNWALSVPRRMLEEVQPLCDVIDKYLLDHPGYTVTFTIER